MTKKCSADGWKTAPDSRGTDMSNSRGRNAIIMSQALKWNLTESCFQYCFASPECPMHSEPAPLLLLPSGICPALCLAGSTKLLHLSMENSIGRKGDNDTGSSCVPFTQRIHFGPRREREVKERGDKVEPHYWLGPFWNCFSVCAHTIRLASYFSVPNDTFVHIMFYSPQKMPPPLPLLCHWDVWQWKTLI